MALLGAEALAAILAMFLVARLGPHIDFSHRFLRGLLFTLPPSDEDLAPLREAAAKKGSAKRRSMEMQKAAAAALEEMPVRQAELGWTMLMRMPLYDVYDMLLSTAIAAVITFLFSQAYTCAAAVLPGQAGFFAAVIAAGASLLSLATFHHTLGWGQLQSVVALLLGGTAGILAFFMLELTDGALDFAMARGFEDLANRTSVLMGELNLSSSVDLATPLHYLVLPLLAGIMSGLFFTPAMHYSHELWDLINHRRVSAAVRGIAWLNFFAPLLLVVMWVRPMTMDMILPANATVCNAGDIFPDCSSIEGESLPWLTESVWDKLRMGGACLYAVLHICLLRVHMQAYLNTALIDYARQLNSSAVDADAFQLKIRSKFNYLSIATLQYLAPALFMLFLAFALIRQSSSDGLGVCAAIYTAMGSQLTLPTALNSTVVAPAPLAEALGIPAERVVLASPLLWRPVLSFLLWWALLVWFLLSAVFLFYWRSNLHLRAAGGSTIAPRKPVRVSAPATYRNKAGSLRPVNPKKKKRKYK